MSEPQYVRRKLVNVGKFESKFSYKLGYYKENNVYIDILLINQYSQMVKTRISYQVSKPKILNVFT